MRNLRAPFLASAVLLAATVPAPAGDDAVKVGGDFAVEVIPDVAYFAGPGADANKHKLDLYLPKGRKDFPVLFFVHGGAWTTGDRKLYAPLGQLLARNGIGAVVISYRLTPQVQHPGHIEDVARAFAWTHASTASTADGRIRSSLPVTPQAVTSSRCSPPTSDISSPTT
jgi:acetyl esterase/lipase